MLKALSPAIAKPTPNFMAKKEAANSPNRRIAGISALLKRERDDKSMKMAIAGKIKKACGLANAAIPNTDPAINQTRGFWEFQIRTTTKKKRIMKKLEIASGIK
jgi:hypothetical protein